MKVDGRHIRTIAPGADGWSVDIIDQTKLPHVFEIKNLRTLDQACHAIRDMLVRGAPLIGATAAYGLCLAVREDPGDEAIDAACKKLSATRPTAVNLNWALASMRAALCGVEPRRRAALAYRHAAELCDEDVAVNRAIGAAGAALIADAGRGRKGDAVNVLTHCNAGWLATVDWGTALSPVYAAHDAGVDVHVWVDETRPRNQGAALTAWELSRHGVPHTVIADNTGGHLMQRGRVDLCIVGTDRTAANGDVCNKIGTYLKALAARDNRVPFYVALPSSTLDAALANGGQVPIEERDAGEVTHVTGVDPGGEVRSVRVTPEQSAAANYAFDVTPARLVTGLITERGVVEAKRESLRAAFPEKYSAEKYAGQ